MPEQPFVFSDDMTFRTVFFNPYKRNSSVSIGKGVDMDYTARIDMTGNVIIWENAYISQGVLIYTHDHIIQKGKSVHESILKVGHIEIGKNAWIGARAIILEKCHRIGEGAVIGAGSVVTHDVPDYEIWAGNPSRRIGEI